MTEKIKVGESRSNEEFEFEDVEREEEEERKERRPALAVKVHVRESVTVSNYLVISIFFDPERGRVSFSVSVPGNGGLKKIGSVRVDALTFVLKIHRIVKYVCERDLEDLESFVKLFKRE